MAGNRTTDMRLLRVMYDWLPARRKRQFWQLLTFIIFTAGVEIFAMLLVALLVPALTDPQAVLQSQKLALARRVMGNWFPSDAQQLVIMLAVAASFFIVLKNALATLVAYVSGRYSALVDGWFGDLLLQGIFRRNYEWHLNENTADLVTAGVWRKSISLIAYNFNTMLTDIAMSLVLVAALFVVAPMITLCVGVALVGMATVLLKISRPALAKAAQAVSDHDLDVNRHVTKAVHGVKDIRVSGREEFFINNYRKSIRRYALSEAMTRMLERLPAYLLESVGFLLLAGVIVVLLLQENISVARITGTLAFLAVAAWKLLPAMNRIMLNLSRLRHNFPMAQKVIGYIDSCRPDMEAFAEVQKHAASALPFEKQLTVEKVSFSYLNSSSKALDKISFTVERGSTVGIVGHSGSGKSTLTDLMMGMLLPSQGQLIVDGVRLDAYTLRTWMDKVGYVSQHPYISDGTLAENIAFGVLPDDVDRERVQECINLAALGDVVSELPQGADTPIGERGARLSGGQRQRVAIARALYDSPEVLILDEATSALDNRSEEAIQQTIRTLSGKLTLIIIAHRLTTVRDCDNIVWLDKGSIRAQGPARDILSSYEKEMADTQPQEK